MHAHIMCFDGIGLKWRQTNYMLTIRTNLGNQLQLRIKSICKHIQFPV